MARTRSPINRCQLTACFASTVLQQAAIPIQSSALFMTSYRVSLDLPNTRKPSLKSTILALLRELPQRILQRINPRLIPFLTAGRMPGANVGLVFLVQKNS